MNQSKKHKPLATNDVSHVADQPDLVEAPWNQATCLALIEQLWTLRSDMLAREVQWQATLDQVLPLYRSSARNLIHYLSLRSKESAPAAAAAGTLGAFFVGSL